MARHLEMYRPLYRKKYREVSVIHCHKELSKFLYIKSSLYFLPHYIPVEAVNVGAITLYGKACRNVRELSMAKNTGRSLQYIAIEISLHSVPHYIPVEAGNVVRQGLSIARHVEM